jgi:acetolactate synthase-1/3 small subunit
MSRHTLAVLVNNQPGVLARVAALFSRRGFNIESLAVGPTEEPSLSRMTIVVNVEEQALEQVSKQLNKLIDVLRIVEMPAASGFERELLLIKLDLTKASRDNLVALSAPFDARIVDEDDASITFELTSTREQLEQLLAIFNADWILELVQSGMVALQRGTSTLITPRFTQQRAEQA